MQPWVVEPLSGNEFTRAVGIVMQGLRQGNSQCCGNSPLREYSSRKPLCYKGSERRLQRCELQRCSPNGG